MRVAVVAGPDPGHVFPAAGLCTALAGAGHETLLVTGGRWRTAAGRAGLSFLELPLLAAPDGDLDAGHRLWQRAADMAVPLAPALAGFGPDLVVADTLTRAGAFAAALISCRWVEWIPHPLADPSRALPPFGTGWAPRPGRDAVLRALAARSRRRGAAQHVAVLAELGLSAVPRPVVRLVATLPALEPPRPDWPADAVLVPPLEWDPAEGELAPPGGTGPLVLCSGSTATGGISGLAEQLVAGLAGLGMRLAVTRLDRTEPGWPAWARAGPGRQAPLLAQAAVVVCGGGHGMVAKALSRGLPLVLVPGGGDQKEVAGRVARLGAGVLARPGRLAAAVAHVLATPAYAAAAGAIAARRPGHEAVGVLERVAAGTWT